MALPTDAEAVGFVPELFGSFGKQSSLEAESLFDPSNGGAIVDAIEVGEKSVKQKVNTLIGTTDEED